MRSFVSFRAGGSYLNLGGQVVAVVVVKKRLTDPLFSKNIGWANFNPAHLLPPALTSFIKHCPTMSPWAILD